MSFKYQSILDHKKVLSLPWLSQMDSDTSQWARMCFSSSSAMFCEYLNAGCLKNHRERKPGEQVDDFYLRKLNELFGDSTDANAQMQMHRWLKVNSRFRQDGTRESLEWHLSKSLPVMTGQLHHGHYRSPNATKSHWNLCVGYEPKGDCFVFHDPAGTMDTVGGGYLNNNGAYRKYPWDSWSHRWMADVDGNFVPGSGWMIVPVTNKATGLYVPL